MFQAKYNLDIQETGTIIAIPFIVFICLGPVLGILLDNIGMRCYILTIGFLCLALSQLIFLRLPACPEYDKCYTGIFPMSLIGMATTIIQLTLYTSINYIVSETHFGTAYGIIQAVGTVGMATGSLMLGVILDIDAGENGEVNVNAYNSAHTFLMIVAIIGVLFTVAVNVYDHNNKRVLNQVITADMDYSSQSSEDN
eukprot:CAMPEP_0202958664 /NCGR_PEP_ID=MMETSP1396-20130829/2944_1 /ASSEMBLY_ACC=CAM_ASM_000872 /TAXON_ID= /ORGANISM="Pseudokeronopsis sp., Strain Brazil" /LENGTH=196 /DNA_ID=CAMNT_0049676835 /DNA_START=1195 /DNA_END=1785 /DNA_ORIENTATION=-